MKKLILIDGNAILHRAYHSIPPFKTSQGEVTNAVYGFCRMLMDLLLKEKPDYIAVAWDRAAPTYRHEEFADYKAHRPEAPEDLYPQVPRIKNILEAFGIQSIELDGFEADDIIGTMAHRAHTAADWHTIILTGDKDTFQLVDDHTLVMMPVSGVSQVVLYDTAKVKEKMGVTPVKIIDYKALAGDSSDNIPGVPGIGPKQAIQLLERYGSLEGIYAHLSELSEGQRKKFEAGRESGFLSRRLATIQCSAPINYDQESLHLRKIDFARVHQLFTELEFHSLERRLGEIEKKFAIPVAQQQSLF